MPLNSFKILQINCMILEFTFFDMPWVVAVMFDISRELLKIESCDKHENSQECESLYYGKFLLTKIVDFIL